METAEAADQAEKRREFTITILGRLLEHLGVQMYKRRDVAIAELVANCWDAGAERVRISVPDAGEYDPNGSSITLLDDGRGMEPDQVEDEYLVVGRNRRSDEDTDVVEGRRILGRKGIGKLAGFGIATEMVVTTWRDGEATRITLNIDELKRDDGEAEKAKVDGSISTPPPDLTEFSESGTRIELKSLKHKTPLDPENLRYALARRYSRSIRGFMEVQVNGIPVEEPAFDFEFRVPEEGFASEVFEEGDKIEYYYGFTENPIGWRELRGFTVMVRGKTAQAPPYFFDVEGRASGQHGTKYLVGEIHADFLDEGTADNDLIATDRQEIDWEDERVAKLKEFGQKLTRKALLERSKHREDKMEEKILDLGDFEERIGRLETHSQERVRHFLRQLGKTEASEESARMLADSLVRAFEYQHFHDVVSDIEDIADDPESLKELLTRLREWKVLESRAILEIVNGRLQIVDKFQHMILNDAPETASATNPDNLHDLLATYPWLLNPEWQVLSEETSITKQLREWDAENLDDGDLRRYDFLALTDERRLVVVEIKRPGHAVDYEEVQRMDTYRVKLSGGTDKELYMMLVSGGAYNFSDSDVEKWDKREDCTLTSWSDIHSRVKRHYQHYRAVLGSDINHPDFDRKRREVARTRDVAATGSAYRGEERRREGLGVQDVNYEESEDEGG